MARRIRLYTASKLGMAPFIRSLADTWSEVEFTSRWLIDHVDDNGFPLYPGDAPHGVVFWEHDHLDILRSDAVMVMGTEGEHLRGALVEVGIALGLRKPVIVVGDHPSYSTWRYHRSVHRVVNVSAARSVLRLMAVRLPATE